MILQCYTKSLLIFGNLLSRLRTLNLTVLAYIKPLSKHLKYQISELNFVIELKLVNILIGLGLRLPQWVGLQEEISDYSKM